MSNVCILTDSTAQFTQTDFPGRERVHIIPFGFRNNTRQEDHSLPRSAFGGQELTAPSAQEFFRWYTRLGRQYDSILVLTLSSRFCLAMQNALQAASQFPARIAVQVVDSQMVAAGLGMLVEAAACAASGGDSLAEIEQKVRTLLPHVYILFCIPELMYLARSGFMSYSQALVGEMMGILPVFTVEEGGLVPIEKVRTPRHLCELYHDFISEFDDPLHIALLCGSDCNGLHTRSVRQYVQESFPQTIFSEHLVQAHLAALLGSRGTGLVIMDQG